MSDVDVRQLRSRWSTTTGRAILHDVLARIQNGSGLEHSGFGMIADRVDLRAIPISSKVKATSSVVGSLAIDQHETIVLRECTLAGLDLSFAQLTHLRMFDVSVSNCAFDQADCRDLRAWGSLLQNSTFEGADLRGAALGGTPAQPVTYGRVSFVRADMRDATSSCADYSDCDFSDAIVNGIDFDSSSFRRCSFAGRLRDVIFWDHGYTAGNSRENPMEDIDFADAEFDFVEFRRLNLDRVRLPLSNNHVILGDYRCVLRECLTALGRDDSPKARGLRGLLQHAMKWIGPEQRRGIFAVSDLGRSEEERRWAAQLLWAAERECHTSA